MGGVDLFPFFSSSCYKGFGDGKDGFYAVYDGLFQTLAEEDQEFSQDEVKEPKIEISKVELLYSVVRRTWRTPRSVTLRLRKRTGRSSTLSSLHTTHQGDLLIS